MGNKASIFLYHQTSETSIERSLFGRARVRNSSTKAAPGVGTPLTKIAIGAGVLLRPARLRAIEQSLGGYRKTIPIRVDEFLFLRGILYLVLCRVLPALCFPFMPVPQFHPPPANQIERGGTIIIRPSPSACLDDNLRHLRHLSAPKTLLFYISPAFRVHPVSARGTVVFSMGIMVGSPTYGKG